MKYPYMTLTDKTELAHGDVREDGTVLVYIETPVDWGFNSAYCVLPSYEWSKIHGYSETEIARFDKLLHHNAHLIIELAQAGGLCKNHHTAYAKNGIRKWERAEGITHRRLCNANRTRHGR